MAPSTPSHRESDPTQNDEPKSLNDKFMGMGKELMIGSLTGWLTSNVMLTFGKIAAVTLGSGILVLQFAHLSGFINTNNTFALTSRVENAVEQFDVAEHKSGFFKKIKNAIMANSVQTAAFTGGFVIGVYFS